LALWKLFCSFQVLVGAFRASTGRQRHGAEIGEKSAIAAQKLKEGFGEAALTGKIKAKMALDDAIKARGIDVTTNDGVVTISGSGPSQAEHDRAMALARDTEGVTRVVDHLEIR
jgi:hyperosmotically inducible protein